VVDHLFVLAVAAIGWGLALASYRELAQRFDWPMGVAQATAPLTVAAIGLAAMASGLLFAMTRGPLNGGFVIMIFGAALAVFWLGFLRVGAQTALLLAPLAAVVLLVAWLGVPVG
jgi:hypothetical protein